MFPATPDVRGMPRDQAIQKLEDAGFTVQIAAFPPPYDRVSCYQPSESTGVVVGQDPCPTGSLSRTRRGSAITIWPRLPDVECDAPPGSGCA